MITRLPILSLFLAVLLAAPLGAVDLRLADPIQSSAGGADPRAVALGRIDGDAFLDAVVVSRSLATFQVLPGRGDGSFAQKSASGSLYLSPTDLVLGDFNGDGVPDIAGINSACLS